MHVGIDASNLRFGGGVTHLVQLLEAASSERDGFERITVWSGSATAARLPQRPWLETRVHSALDRSLPFRAAWRRWALDRAAARAGIDLLLVPGGAYSGSFRPFVTMCRNLVPFDDEASRRYGISALRLKWALLRRAQSATFRRADGVVFLTRTARDLVRKHTGPLAGREALIPHGVAARFFHEPRPQRPVESFAEGHPFRWLYVSTVDGYKHQVEAARASVALRELGHSLRLDLVGHTVPAWERRLERTLASLDPGGRTVRFLGPLPFDELHRLYQEVDGFLFASSCENLPNILLEAMAAGLPIACSERSVMPEVLGDAGVYFDPERPESIAEAMDRLMEDETLRTRCGAAAHQRAGAYSWPLCAERTFQFLRQVAGRATPIEAEPAPADGDAGGAEQAGGPLR